MDKDDDRFVRWQQLSISEMGKTISLFLGIAFATIGFVVSQLISADFIFRNYWDKFLFSFGSVVLLAHIVVSLILTLNRLKDFKLTTKVVRVKQNEKSTSAIADLREELEMISNKTRCLFGCSLWLFGIAELLIIIGFIIQISNKF
ncbi:MAG: hypothetical protein WC217_02085 [Candidatus Paceibacterota bacterium]|jgi:uncharacterized membrane protein YbhN (UPF0104 family)